MSATLAFLRIIRCFASLDTPALATKESHFTRPEAFVGHSEVRISPDHRHRRAFLGSHLTRPFAKRERLRETCRSRARPSLARTHFTRPRASSCLLRFASHPTFCEVGEIEKDVPQRRKAQPGKNAFHPTSHPQAASPGRISPDRMGDFGSTVSHFTQPTTHFLFRDKPFRILTGNQNGTGRCPPRRISPDLWRAIEVSRRGRRSLWIALCTTSMGSHLARPSLAFGPTVVASGPTLHAFGPTTDDYERAINDL